MRGQSARWFAAFILCTATIGCEVNQQSEESRAVGSGVPRKPAKSIRIASFNIQVFGKSKSQKLAVMDVLARVVRRFDVVAIQELRAKDDQIVPNFVTRINENGRRYDYLVGPRLGRSSSKEQYVYLFDSEVIEVIRGSVYTVNDPDDLLHREPLVARFRAKTVAGSTPFSFTLINVHTDPDETDIELDVLDNVYRVVSADGSGEDDVILLGDLNVDHRHLGELGKLPKIAWTVSGEPTNARGTKSYDNIVYNKQSTVEFTGKSGVFDLAKEFGLSKKEVLKVSDHLPVWAEFSSSEGEAAPLVASRPR